jgi:hypothetical protein
MRGLTQEVQLEINTLLFDPLESAEMGDWTQSGKVRSALEKKIETPRTETKITEG